MVFSHIVHGYRSGGSTPTQAELDAAWDENAALGAQNAALDAQLMELEGRAEASVLHMAQMRRVVAQLKANKVKMFTIKKMKIFNFIRCLEIKKNGRLHYAVPLLHTVGSQAA